jgi:hypothetical protein
MQEEQYIYINKNGSKFVYKNKAMTVLHNLDGPAVDYAEGDTVWFVNGNIHRTDGPAVECADGTKEWFVNGKRHRSDGPAVERADGTKDWYANGKRLNEKQFNARYAKPVELTLEDIAAKFGIDINNLKIVK